MPEPESCFANSGFLSARHVFIYTRLWLKSSFEVLVVLRPLLKQRSQA